MPKNMKSPHLTSPVDGGGIRGIIVVIASIIAIIILGLGCGEEKEETREGEKRGKLESVQKPDEIKPALEPAPQEQFPIPASWKSWKDDFSGDFRWQKFERPPESPNWDVIKGEFVATVMGIFRDMPPMPRISAGGWALPANAPMEIAEEDDVVAEVRLKVEPIALRAAIEPLFRSIGLVIAKKDELKTFYTATWFPTVGKMEEMFAVRSTLNVGFLGAGPIGAAFIGGVGPAEVEGSMGSWHKMRLMIKQLPFKVQVYWNGELKKEFGAPIIGAKDDFFPVGAIGLWAGGYAFDAYFDDFVMAWGH